MQGEVDKITSFIKETLSHAHTKKAVVSVSGGIDSGLSLTLAVKALGPESVVALLLPYRDQDMVDARMICSWNHIPPANILEKNIKFSVDQTIADLEISQEDLVRRGNVMARTRMMFVFDTAKTHKALVIGTENKSEHFLGYFTRYGDEASDIEPIGSLYKTDVRRMAKVLGIPNAILDKSPSAGLWQGQTDEDELGFSYEDADKVLNELIDEGKDPGSIKIEGVLDTVVQSVCFRVKSLSFKREVPYRLKGNSHQKYSDFPEL